jgi:hypothetical protein
MEHSSDGGAVRSEAMQFGFRQSQKLVQELARRTGHPVEEVRAVYESQFEMLDRQARVKIYLPILAARHAGELLRSH